MQIKNKSVIHPDDLLDLVVLLKEFGISLKIGHCPPNNPEALDDLIERFDN
jgi:hypothetical protein